MRVLAIGFAWALVCATSGDQLVRDPATAIQIAQKVCNLPAGSLSMIGPWHASLVGKSWHVWDGRGQTEPFCNVLHIEVDAGTGRAGKCLISMCLERTDTTH